MVGGGDGRGRFVPRGGERGGQPPGDGPPVGAVPLPGERGPDVVLVRYEIVEIILSLCMICVNRYGSVRACVYLLFFFHWLMCVLRCCCGGGIAFCVLYDMSGMYLARTYSSARYSRWGFTKQAHSSNIRVYHICRSFRSGETDQDGSRSCWKRVSSPCFSCRGSAWLGSQRAPPPLCRVYGATAGSCSGSW